MAKKGKISKHIPSQDIDVRPIKWKRYYHLFLIVCEDQKTEPYYFEKFKEKFPKETVFIRPVCTGRSSKGVVEQTVIERNKLYEESHKTVDEVWAVFDKDDADKTTGNIMAEYNNIRGRSKKIVRIMNTIIKNTSMI